MYIKIIIYIYSPQTDCDVQPIENSALAIFQGNAGARAPQPPPGDLPRPSTDPADEGGTPAAGTAAAPAA